MKIVIVGASFAGLSCALEAAKLYPQAEICLIDARQEPLYTPNTVVRLLTGDISDIEDAKVDLWEQVLKQPVKLFLGHQFVALHSDRQEVTLQVQDKTLVLAYDRLVLALGAEQNHQLAQQGLDPYLLTFKGKKNSVQSLEKLRSGGRVGIVGAGQMGMEILAALHQAGIDARIFETQAGPLGKHLDSDFSERLRAIMVENKVASHFHTSVNWVSLSALSKPCIESLSDKIEVDWVVLATNFTPNTQNLPKEMEQNQDGSLWVDDYLRTNLPHIWAVGDLIQLPVAYFGRSYLPMIKHSLFTGRLAAHNFLGNSLPLQAVKRQVSSCLWGWTVLSLGFTSRELQLCEDFVSFDVMEEEFCLRLHLHPHRQILLGAQLLTKEKASELIELLIWAVEGEVQLNKLFASLMGREQVTLQERKFLSLLKKVLTIGEVDDEV